MAKLADGVSVAGSVFSTSGESVQMFTALLGAGTAATQRSGSEVARGLRTILMNIRQIKGETEDGELINGESISKASTALKEYAGIQTIVDGELRKGSDVLRELAGKWDSLGSVAQSALAEALGGKYRANILVALMSDWDAVEKQMRDYASGAGSALAENEKYLDSWTAKSAKLSAAWTEFVSASLDSGTIKSILGGTTNIIDALGNLSTAALAALGYITAAKLPAMINGFTALRSELGSLIQGFKKGEDGTSAFGRAMQTTQGKISMAQAGIAALTTVVLVAVTAYNSWKSAQKEALRSATESAERTSESYKRLTDLINEYKDLASNGGIDADVGNQEQARSIQEQIVELVGDQASAIDLVNGGYEEMLGILDDIATKQQEISLRDLESAYDKSNSVVSSLMGDLVGGQFGATTNIDAISKVLDDYSRIKVADYSIGSLMFKDIKGVSEAKEAIDELYKLRDYMQDNGMKSDPLYISIIDAIAKFEPDVKAAIASQDLYFKSLIRVKAGADATAESIAAAAYALVVERNMSEEDAKAMYARRDALIALMVAGEQTEQNGDDITEDTVNLNEYADAISKAKERIDLLAQAQREQNATGKISEETAQKLKEAYADENIEMMRQGDCYVLATDALSDLTDKEKDFLDKYGEITDADVFKKLVDDAIGFTDEIQNATNALSALQKKLKEGGEKGDAFNEYKTAYQSAMELYGQGKYGSNEFQGMADLLLGPDIMRELKWNYEEAGKLLGNDFFKAMFTGEQDDYGQNALEYLTEQYGDVTDENGNLVASFRKTEDGIDATVYDFDALADKLGTTKDVLMTLFDALGIWSSGLNTTSDDVNKALDGMAEGTVKLDNSVRKVDFASFVKQLADAGKSEKEINQLYEAAKGMSDIEFTGDTEDVTEKIRKAVEDAKAFSDTIYSSKADIDTTDGTTALDTLDAAGKSFASNTYTAKATIQQTGGAISGFFGALGLAGGTRNATGGLTLVNELGGEIISQDGRAFVANNGKPAVVDLKPGAIVLNHEESKQALSNGAIHSSINAASGGILDGIVNAATALWHGLFPGKDDDKNKPGGKGGKGSSKKAVEEDKTDWWKVIEDYYDHATKKAQRAIDKLQYKLKKLQDSWDDEKEPIQDQIDALERINDQIDRQITLLERERDSLIKPIDAQIKAMEDARDIQDEELELAEKKKAVTEAEANLQNAQNERNIRYFDKETGQWKWMADQKAVADAQKGIEDAKKDLSDYEYQMEINALTRKRDAIEAEYQTQIDALDADKTANDDAIYELSQQLLALEDKYKALMKPLEDKVETLERQLDAAKEKWSDVELEHDKPEGNLDAAIKAVAAESGLSAAAIKKAIDAAKKAGSISAATLRTTANSDEVQLDPSILVKGSGANSSAIKGAYGLMLDGVTTQTYDSRSYVNKASSNVNSNNISYSINGLTISKADAENTSVSELFSKLALYTNGEF